MQRQSIPVLIFVVTGRSCPGPHVRSTREFKTIITTHNCFLTSENAADYIKGHKIAINALDFSSDVPLVFDQICQEQNIPVLHPYNLGWGGLVAV